MPEKKIETQFFVADQIKPMVNRYYLKVSRRYMILGIVLMLALILYLVCVMLFFGEYVTYDNLKYLVRDWNAMTMPGAEEVTKIVYNGSDSMSFAPFRGGLAVCSGDTYAYYDSSGILLVEDSLSFADPAFTSSDKYMLLYDVGGTSYAVYNQLTRIIGRETDGKIIAGDIANDGSMVLARRSRETRFVVEVYNAAFNKVMNIYKDNYVLDAAVSPDGSMIVICSAVTSDTDFNAEVEICRNGSAERVSLTTYQHTMPLRLETYDDRFIMLCDNGMYFFDYSGQMQTSVSFDGMRLSYADHSDKIIAAIGSANALGSENRLLVLDTVGNILLDKQLSKRVTGVAASENIEDGLAYLITTDGVLKVLTDGTTTETETTEVLAVIPQKKGALLCLKNGAFLWKRAGQLHSESD